MWKTIVEGPYFGICISILMYLIAAKINKKLSLPITNPLLVGGILTIIFLLVTGVSYDQYMVGGKYITFLIAPATIALVLNLYKNIELLKKNLFPVLIGVFAGVVTSVTSAFLLAKLFMLDDKITMSVVPKSLTTAIGVALSEEYGGVASIAVVAIFLTGITGAVIAPIVMKIFKVKDPVAQGIGIGTTSHAVGTSKALEMGEIQGAMSGLSIALSGFISVIVIPILLTFFL